jgi:predicted transcriptional regulator
MTATTSLKLPDALKEQIAVTAAREGKTAHALMVETLQTAMDDARMRQQYYDDGDASYQDMVHTNISYAAADVHNYMLAKVRGENPSLPSPKPHDRAKPMTRK